VFSNAAPAFSPPAAKDMVIGHIIIRGEPPQVTYCFSGGGKEYPLVDGTPCRLVENEQAAQNRYVVPYHSLKNETRVPRLSGRVLGPVHVFTYTPGKAWERAYLHFRNVDTLEVLSPQTQPDGTTALGNPRVLSSMWRVDLKGAQDISVEAALADEARRNAGPATPPSAPAALPAAAVVPESPPAVLDEDTIERAFNLVVAFFEARVAEGENDQGEAQAALDAFHAWEKRRESMDDAPELDKLPVYDAPTQAEKLPVHETANAVPVPLLPAEPAA
jgi:hypothetical protein